MTWRREDYGYAAATVAAVLFLAYLIAGNFGLVPSPLGGGRAGKLPQVQVAALFVAGPAPRPITLVAVAAAPIPAGPSAARADKTKTHAGPPSAFIDTKSGTTVKLVQKPTVIGRVLAPAGVRQVLVQFSSPSAGVATVKATTHCATTTNCAWSVAVPNTVGTFKVIAVASDSAGHAALSNTITITVVNAANVVGGVVGGVGSAVGGVGTVVQNAPSTLTNTINNVLGVLGL